MKQIKINLSDEVYKTLCECLEGHNDWASKTENPLMSIEEFAEVMIMRALVV